MKTAPLPTAVLALVLVAAGRGGATELVANGGFETGDFTGWGLSGNTDFTFVTNDDPFDGSFYAHLQTSAANLAPLGTLSQDLTTVSGQKYTFSFYLASTSDLNLFQASFGGAPVRLLAPVLTQDYTQYKFSVTATSTTTPIEFDFRSDVGEFRLDNVSVTPAAATPEPGTLLLLGGLGGGCALGHFWRRRRLSPA